MEVSSRVGDNGGRPRQRLVILKQEKYGGGAVCDATGGVSRYFRLLVRRRWPILWNKFRKREARSGV